MTLRRRTLFTIGITLIGLIAILYFLARTILLDGFIQLERQSLERDIQRVTSALQDSITQLDRFNQDWAGWDDTYAFIQDRNEAYIHDNLSDQYYIKQQINLTLFVNTSGKVVYGKLFDLESERALPILADAQTLLTSEELLNLPELTSTVLGIITLPEGHLLFSSRPILTSEYQGPIQGAIIMGQFLDQTVVDHLAANTHLSIKMWSLDRDSLPSEIQTIPAQLTAENPIVVRPLQSDTVAGYTTISDIYGQPALLVQVDKSRDLYLHGQTTLSYFLAALVLTGLIFTLVVLSLLERTVLARLLSLSHAVDRVRFRTADLYVTLPIKGKDELAQLGINMRAMLATIQQYQDELRETNADLEHRVLMRTQELASAIVRLQQEIAEKERVQIELAQARDQAIEAFKLKTQILANVSHDSRTPLNIIILSAEMMQRYAKLDPKWNNKLTHIITSAHQLLDFFNNLLEEARHSTGNDKLNKVQFSPREMIENIVTPMVEMAHNKGLELTIEITEDVPANLCSDLKRVEQIVSNLVGNAIKFTAEGGIAVRLFRPAPEQWAIAVSDTGRGIESKNQPHIFDAFWQVDGSMTREVMSGVGLGLSIVKQSATLLGGWVEVQSEIGSGTIFTVTLPLEEVVNTESCPRQ